MTEVLKRYWRHGLVVLAGTVVVVGLQWVGVLVLPQSLPLGLKDRTPLTLDRPLVAVTASPSATLAPSFTPTPTVTLILPTPTATPVTVWLQPVSDPLGYSAVINKKYELSASFVPPDLRSVAMAHTNNHPLRATAATALEHMALAAADQGIHLRLLSGYRSYATQSQLYQSYVAGYGQAAADRFSARPGHSEHQSGLALDIGDADTPVCDIKACFATTAGGTWVAAHAAEFGYIVRYTAAKETITGYMAEPWHIRYVGPELAGKLVASGLSMEEYLGVAGGGY